MLAFLLQSFFPFIVFGWPEILLYIPVYSSAAPQRTAYSEVTIPGGSPSKDCQSSVSWGDCWIQTRDCRFTVWCHYLWATITLSNEPPLLLQSSLVRFALFYYFWASHIRIHSNLFRIPIRYTLRWIRIQTEQHSHLGAASSASLDDETDDVFGYMKRKCCESSSFLSPLCSPVGEAKVGHSLAPLP